MYPNFDKPFTFDRVIRLLISSVFIGAGVYLLYILKGVLLPFLIAWLIAYLLNPLVRFVQYRLRVKNRVLAVTLTLFSVAGILSLLIYLLIPTIQREVYQINSLIYNYQLGIFSVEGIPTNLHDFILNNIDFKSLQDALSKEGATDGMHYLLPALSGVVSNTISVILSMAVVFIIILYLIFILIDYDKINELWRNLIPPKYRYTTNQIISDVEKNMNNYFRHQTLICVILAFLYSLGFQIIGLPLAIVLGIFVGVLHMVPYLQVVSVIPAVLLCWLKVSQTDENFWTLISLIALVYIIVQCILDLFLVPKIMGKAMGLNPAIILLSLSIWGYLMGIVGMIIAIPLTTLLLSYYQTFIASMSTDIIDKNEVKDASGIG